MKINARNQIQYGGPHSVDVPDTKTPNEISALGPLGIGGTKDSFETGKSITDGTSKDLPGGRLMQQGIILQNDKDLDAKIAFADGSVKPSDLQNLFKKGELK